MPTTITPLFALVLVIGLVPILAVVTTAFSKVSVILLIVRNALGIQQTPPNIVLFAVAIVISVVAMQPVLDESVRKIPLDDLGKMSMPEMSEVARHVAEPFRAFMLRNSEPSSRQMIVDTAQRRTQSVRVEENDFSVVIPAFLLDELTKAFELGFTLYIPFIIVDFVVSAVLVGLGLQMMSATTIATPLKILLFVEVSGWTKLFQMLTSSYG